MAVEAAPSMSRGADRRAGSPKRGDRHQAGLVRNSSLGNWATTGNIAVLGYENPGDSWDLGLVGDYTEESTVKTCGVFRDASDGGRFKIFQGSEQTFWPNADTVNTAATGYQEADLQVGTLFGDVSATSVVTDSLSRTSGAITLGSDLDGFTNTKNASFSRAVVGSSSDMEGALTVHTNSQFTASAFPNARGLFVSSSGSSAGDFGGYMYLSQARMADTAGAALVTKHQESSFGLDWYSLEIYTKPGHDYETDLVKTASFQPDGNFEVNGVAIPESIEFHSSTSSSGNNLHRRTDDLYWGNTKLNTTEMVFNVMAPGGVFTHTMTVAKDMTIHHLYVRVDNGTGEINVFNSGHIFFSSTCASSTSKSVFDPPIRLQEGDVISFEADVKASFDFHASM